MVAHHSPGACVGSGSCMGVMIAHHSLILGLFTILAQSALKSSPMYSK